LHLGHAVPGDPGDNYSFLWNLWWMRHVLATPGFAFFHTGYLFSPFGTTIADHPHTALPALVAATLLKSASIVTAQNVLLLTYVFANMAAMYALVWTMTRHRRAAVLAGVLFGLSPYLAVHLLGHFDLVAAWMLPAFALALRHAVLRSSNAAAVAAGVLLAATAYIAYYYVVYLCLFTVVYVLTWAEWITVTRAAGSPRRFATPMGTLFLCGAIVCAAAALAIVLTGGRTITLATLTVSARTPQNVLTVMWVFVIGWIVATWRPVFVFRGVSSAPLQRGIAVVWRVVTVFLVGSSPLFWQAARLVVRGEYVTPEYGWRSIPHGVDLLAPLLGHPLHPLFHAASARAYDAAHVDYIEAIGWIGVVPALLLVVARSTGLNAATRAELRVWRAVLIAFVLWSLGPFLTIGGFDTGLKLPEILARFVPFVANARMPGRAMVGVFMALAVLVGVKVSAATGRLRTPAAQWLVIGLVAFEYWDAPLRLTTLDHPSIYWTLAVAEAGAVCEVPFGIGDGLSAGVGSQDRRVLFYATLHEHPLVGGYIGRMPADAERRYEEMPIVGALLRISDHRPAAAASALGHTTTAPCRYLVVNRAASSGELLAYVRELPADIIATDDAHDLYRLR
jgi:hypothetical protein